MSHALVAALKRNDVDGVRRVLASEPDVARRVNEPMPGLPFDSAPLHAAVGRGNREMIDVLLGAGADINVRTRWWAGGFGVLDTADPALVPFLLARGAVVDAHAAARLGMTDRLRQLVASDPSLVHARGGDGQTPLHFASTIEIADALLERGANIDARDVDHESTPAQYMIRDRQAVARHLVSRGCATDVLMAAALGDIGLVRRHLDADPASVRMNVSERYFPRQNPRSGGTIYIWTLGGHKTAHVLAREFGHQAVFDLLMERSPAPLTLVVAAALGDVAAAKALVDADPAILTSMTDDDRAALPHAAERNDTAGVRWMLEIGWPVDARGESGETALHWAGFHGNADMARTLLRHHAPVDMRDRMHDATPLGWATHGSLHGWHRNDGDYAATVNALLSAGATPPADAASIDASEPVRDVLRRFKA